MVNRDDVARAAGVSAAVVSYVVNSGPRPVAPHTRLRVEEAIARLGYRPDGIARALVTRRSSVFALVVPEAVNSFFAQLAQAIEMTCFSHGYTLLVGSAEDDPAVELRYIQTFIERGVDGVILSPSASAESVAELLASVSMPTVVIDRLLNTNAFDSVVVDNYGGAYAATAHLIEHGHRDVACIAGPRDLSTARDRERGWRDALRLIGAGRVLSPCLHAAYSKHAAYEATRELLTRAQPPTALFATADEQAVGIYRAVAELGRRIPDDLAVVSFDNADAAGFAVPGLTTIHQPLEQDGPRGSQPPNHSTGQSEARADARRTARNARAQRLLRLPRHRSLRSPHPSG